MMTALRRSERGYTRRLGGSGAAKHRNFVALGLVALLVLVGCISTSATAASIGQTQSGFHLSLIHI